MTTERHAVHSTVHIVKYTKKNSLLQQQQHNPTYLPLTPPSEEFLRTMFFKCGEERAQEMKILLYGQSQQCLRMMLLHMYPASQLPYNAKYKIPKHRKHITNSMALQQCSNCFHHYSDERSPLMRCA